MIIKQSFQAHVTLSLVVVLSVLGEERDGIGGGQGAIIEEDWDFKLRLASVSHTVLEVVNSHGEEGQVAAYISELISHLKIIRIASLHFSH